MQKYSFLQNEERTEIVKVRLLKRVKIVPVGDRYSVVGLLEDDDKFLFTSNVDIQTARKRLNNITAQLNELLLIFEKRWLKFSEAEQYAPCGKKKLRKLIGMDKGHPCAEIYATKDDGDIIVDRFSIDNYYDRDRQAIRGRAAS